MVSAPVIVRQRPVDGELDAVGGQLTAAFEQIRAALQAQRDVVVVVSDADLLGQREPADAAVATGLLGLVRAFALEGARPGWCVNALACRDEDEATVTVAATGLSALPGVSGELVRLGSAHLGKVLP